MHSQPSHFQEYSILMVTPIPGSRWQAFQLLDPHSKNMLFLILFHRKIVQTDAVAEATNQPPGILHLNCHLDGNINSREFVYMVFIPTNHLVSGFYPYASGPKDFYVSMPILFLICNQMSFIIYLCKHIKWSKMPGNFDWHFWFSLKQKCQLLWNLQFKVKRQAWLFFSFAPSQNNNHVVIASMGRYWG